MKILSVEVSCCRGHVDSASVVGMRILGQTERFDRYAKAEARDARREADPSYREFYGSAERSRCGRFYYYGAGEEAVVYLIPETHPAFEIADESADGEIAGENIDRFCEAIGWEHHW